MGQTTTSSTSCLASQSWWDYKFVVSNLFGLSKVGMMVSFWDNDVPAQAALNYQRVWLYRVQTNPENVWLSHFWVNRMKPHQLQAVILKMIEKFRYFTASMPLVIACCPWNVEAEIKISAIGVLFTMEIPPRQFQERNIRLEYRTCLDATGLCLYLSMMASPPSFQENMRVKRSEQQNPDKSKAP